MDADQVLVVSVIIPTFNEERHLGSVLAALALQSYARERLEIIVVDNGSTDATVAIAVAAGATVHVVPGVTVGALRNFGVKKANGEILAFLDADCLPAVDWVAAGVAALGTEPIFTGAPYELPLHPTWLEEAWFCQKGSGRRKVNHINAGNVFVRRELFLEIGGFDERLITGEDAELCARASKKAKVLADDTIIVRHLGNPKTLRQFLRREIWLGLGAFGSFRINWRDKPLAGTLLFAVATVLQIIGFVAGIFGGSFCLFIGANGLLLLLLAGTLLQRRAFIKGLRHAAILAFLYYLFYLGRSISLVLLLSEKSFYHHNKSS